ncbi:MAG: hypothetical protein FP815_05120 [Desulfobulbaceae bacterium]|nr:hypothetical protein [Desulfobulbaceae bacterium]
MHLQLAALLEALRQTTRHHQVESRQEKAHYSPDRWRSANICILPFF